MAVKSTTKKPCEIKLLRRCQRGLLLGGGILLSQALVFGACFAIWSDIQNYIADGRAAYVANKALITQVIEKKQAAMRRGIIYSELVWSTIGSDRSVDNFRQGRQVMQANPFVISQLVLGAVTPEQPAQRFARFMEFSETWAYAMTASAGERGESFAGYFFDPAHTFLSIAWPPISRALLEDVTAHEVPALIARLAPDIGDLGDPAYLASLRETRRVFWLPPAPGPLSGETVLQVVEPGFDGNRPFAIFVSNLPFDALYQWLRKPTYGGNFMIVDRSGELILSSWDRETIDPGLTAKVLGSGAWREQLDSPDYVYRDGIFTISEPLADTGWILAYAYSWRTILAVRGNFIMAYAGGMLLTIALLWTLIYFYFTNVLSPLLLRSQRVFDSEKFNRAIIATAPNGLCLIAERSGQVVLQNEVMKLYDNGGESLSGRFMQLGREAGFGIATQTSAGPVAIHDLTVTIGTNESRHLLVNTVRIRYLSEDLLLCSFSDITAHKQLEQGLREARGAAEAANRAKSVFLATMSHEIRTPLNGILGNLELLAHTPLTALQQDRLKTVTGSSRALLDIINDILDFSKIESGQMRMEQIPFDIIDLAEQAIAIFAPMADDKGLDLFYRIEPQLPRWHIGDPTRLRQVIVNLLSNAIKFTAHGKVDIELAPDRDRSGAGLVLRIADTGIGIPAGRRKQLFQPFEQGDVSVARHYGGTGLGLAICRRLVKLMGGAIDVVSEEGKGSVFTVRLPLNAAAGAMPEAVPLLPMVEVGVLCKAPEWQAQLLPQLQAWGLKARLIKCPEEWLQSDGPLMLFGSPRPWSVAGEERAAARAGCLIDVQEDGPRLPVMQRNRILVSCYSIEGLRCALLLAMSPIAQETGGPRRTGALPAPAVKSAAAHPIRVLVVEDHPINLSLIGEQLQLLGYQTSLAGKAVDALQRFSEQEYDIVLTDLCMPGVGGYLLARMLREQRATLPIVAITAHASQEDYQRCRSAGIDGILLKPMSLKEIDQMIRRHLEPGKTMPTDRSEMRGGLSKKMARVLRETSEASLASMRTACACQRHDSILEHLHAIKGAFAMQRQEQVVAACSELESDCKSGMPANFLTGLGKLDILVRDALKRIDKAAG